MPLDRSAKVGLIEWTDITVPDAETLRDFYTNVVGWKFEEVPMSGYSDYAMTTPNNIGAPVAGICHAKGENTNLPPVWLVYLNVYDIEASRKTCASLGGKLLTDVKVMPNYGKFCVIEDPQGAVSALFEPIDDDNDDGDDE